MEKRVNAKISLFLRDFKKSIKDYVDVNVNINTTEKQDEYNALLQFIYDYPNLELNGEDFSKRKRVKNTVPLFERCCALRANNEQCTRRKRDNKDYCGTHIKGRPYGEITNTNVIERPKTITLTSKEIHGILYYIDNNGNVYNTHEVMENKKNPNIIAKYIIDDDGNYTIPSIFDE